MLGWSMRPQVRFFFFFLINFLSLRFSLSLGHFDCVCFTPIGDLSSMNIHLFLANANSAQVAYSIVFGFLGRKF